MSPGAYQGQGAGSEGVWALEVVLAPCQASVVSASAAPGGCARRLRGVQPTMPR